MKGCGCSQHGRRAYGVQHPWQQWYAYFLQETAHPVTHHFPEFARRSGHPLHRTESRCRVSITVSSVHTNDPFVAYINEDTPRHPTLTPCSEPEVYHPKGERVFTVQHGLYEWAG